MDDPFTDWFENERGTGVVEIDELSEVPAGSLGNIETIQ